MSFLRLLLAAAVAAWIATGAAAARQDEIPVGMTAAFSGPLQLLGRSMQSGIEICFAETNAAGGIKGRPLRLIALDDSYDPETAAANMRRLVRDHGVIAMVGSVGTPTAVETLPIARAEKVLLFGAFTGA
ncbi:MAG TPA: ABC transporter substrate-binding protein, partial [Sphingomonadales bacterium]